MNKNYWSAYSRRGETTLWPAVKPIGALMTEELREGLWAHPWIPWTHAVGSLALGVWFFYQGAWWQIVLGLFLGATGVMSLKAAIGIAVAKVAHRRVQRQNREWVANQLGDD